jgi:hypothetical protein
MSTARKYLLIGLLLAAFSIVAVSFQTSKANPDTITVQIVPSTENVNPGEQFYANVTISGVNVEHDLVGIEFQIKWNTTLLTGIKMELPQGHIFQAAQDDGNLWIIKKAMNDTMHPDTAWYYVTCSDLAVGYNGGYLPLTGSGVICKITFNATSTPGNSALYFTQMPPTNVKVKLANGQAVQITDYTIIDSAITVIPEFPNSIIYTILLTLSLIVAVICKKFPKNRFQTF